MMENWTRLQLNTRIGNIQKLINKHKEIKTLNHS